jgi:hypothetical protein
MMQRKLLNVTVRMSMEEAETLSAAMSDLLCWCAGFNAALSPSEDHHRRPYGVNAARELNIKIKSAMDQAEKEESDR